MSGAGYRVVPAEPKHLAALPGIELAAARLFERHIDPALLEDHTDLEEFSEAQENGQLWVALNEEGDPVGFALADEHDGRAHLEEIDVHPDHGRRGLGARLVRAVCEWSEQRGLGEVTITTYKDVPWNEPFYRRLGFSVVPPGQLSPALREIVAKETGRGLDPERRVVMRWSPKRSGHQT